MAPSWRHRSRRDVNDGSSLLWSLLHNIINSLCKNTTTKIKSNFDSGNHSNSKEINLVVVIGTLRSHTRSPFTRNDEDSPWAIKVLLLKLLCQKSCAQDEGRVLLPLDLQITCDLQYVLAVESGNLSKEQMYCDWTEFWEINLKVMSDSSCLPHVINTCIINQGWSWNGDYSDAFMMFQRTTY